MTDKTLNPDSSHDSENLKDFKDFKYTGDRNEDGECHGEGVYHFRDGSRYQGSFVDGRMEGIGRYTFRNGDSYVGEWHADRMNGSGIYKWASGFQYEGQLENDRFHGQGAFLDNHDRLIYLGAWKYDQPVDRDQIIKSLVARQIDPIHARLPLVNLLHLLVTTATATTQ